MPKNATRPSQDKHENGAYLFPEIDDPAFEEAMTSAIAKIMADSSDLSKAAPGEQLEYLTPGEKPPGETPVRTTQRGARGYYPSEVAGGEEEAAAPREAEPTEEREIEAVQAPEAKPELSPPFGSTLVEGYADRRIVPRTPKSEGGGPPTHLYRVMDKRQYDDAVKEGELNPAPEEFGGDGRIHGAGKPNFQYADPKPTVLVAIEYSDDDGWAARQAGVGDITAATSNPIPISKVTVLAEGANGGELQDNYKLISDNLSKLLVLETALEYLTKQESGKREYLAPGEEAPEGVRVERGQRGGRYYTPDKSVHSSDIDRALGTTEEGIRQEIHRLAELPEEEREIDVVAPPEPEEQPDMLIPNVVNEYFDTVATNLENLLIKVVGEGHQPFLGNEVLPSKLTADNITKAGYTDGSKEGVGYPSGLGINSYENFTVTIGTGFLGRQKSQFIYKMVPGENRGEILAYSIDRTLGLNIVPFVKQHSIDVFTLSDQLEQAHGDPIQDYSLQEMREKGVDTRAAGHFQEFCDNCVGRDEQPKIMAEMMSTEKGREEFFKIMLLDYITGNSDRHTGNYLITEDGKIVAIDNGMIAGTRKPHSEQASVNLVPNTFGWLSFPYGLSEEMDKIQDIETLTTDDLQDEAANFFDKHFNQDKLDAVLATVNWKAFPQYNH